MIRWFTLSVVLTVAAVSLADDPSVRGSGTIVTESRTLGEFERIEISGAVDIDIAMGEATPLTIEADDNILPLIKTEIRTGTLHITADQSYESKHGVDIKITLPVLISVSASGTTDVNVVGLDNESFGLAVNGQADANVSGRVNHLTAAVNGQADVNAFELLVRNATLTVNGQGDAKVHVTDSLAIVINGAGDVQYKGSPQVQQVINGNGDVHKTD